MNSTTSLIPEGNIQPSSSAPGKTPNDLRLNGDEAWIPDETDTSPSVVIELERPTDVTGIILQGGGDSNPNEYVKLFIVEYSSDGVTYAPVVHQGGIPVVRISFWQYPVSPPLRNEWQFPHISRPYSVNACVTFNTKTGLETGNCHVFRFYFVTQSLYFIGPCI